MKALLALLALTGTAIADDDPNLPPPPIPQQLMPPILDQPRSGPPDPASLTIPPQDPPMERVFDSRDAFDSRRATHPFGLMLETQFTHVFGETVAALSITLAPPVAPKFGRLRISLGSYLDGDDRSDPFNEDYDPMYLRFALGWERWAFCIHRKVCPGVAADLSYAFVDPLDGTLIAPHAFLDIKSGKERAAGIRLAAGPTVLMATDTSGGRNRFDVGFSIHVNFMGWGAF